VSAVERGKAEIAERSLARNREGPASPPGLISLREAASGIGVTAKALCDRIARGKLAAQKVNGRLWVAPGDVEPAAHQERS
jgi:hypothetical protein